MSTPLTERESDSFFYYVDAAGRACVRVKHDPDGASVIQHKAPNRHWKAGWPEGLQLPYRYRDLIASSADQLVYIVADEREAEILAKDKRVATVIRFPLADLSQTNEWIQCLKGKRVLLVPNQTAQGTIQAARLLASLKELAAWVMDVQLDGLDIGEGLYEWLEKRNFDLTELDDFVYRLTCEREKTRRTVVHRGLPPSDTNGNGHLPADGDDDDEDLYEGWQPFPLDTLPPILAKYVDAASKSLPCDPALIAVPALICCAGAIGNKRLIQLKATWQEPSILWGVVVAGSGSKKSPAFDLAKDPLVNVDTDLVRSNKKRLLAHQDELWTWEARNGKQGRAEGNPADDPRPERPVDKRVIISDITVETVIKESSKNLHGLLLLRDELRGWFQSFGRYSASGSGGADLSFWLEAYRGKQYRYDRKGGDGTSLIVPRCSVSVYGTIQPETMQRLFTPEFFDSGFAYRLLMCLPPRRRGKWNDAVIPLEVKEDYHALLRELFTADGPLMDSEDWVPRVRMFDEEGYRAWIHHHDEFEAMADDAQGHTENLLEKLKATIARLALVFSEVDNVQDPVRAPLVKKDHVQQAARLTKWFFHEIQRVYSLIHMAPEQFELQRVVEWIKAKGGAITARDLYKSNKSAYASSKSAELCLEQLCMKGLGAYLAKPTTARGGRPTRIFSLYGRNPETAETQN